MRNNNYLTIQKNDSGETVNCKIPIKALFYETVRNSANDDTAVVAKAQNIILKAKDADQRFEQLLMDDEDRMDFVKRYKGKVKKPSKATFT